MSDGEQTEGSNCPPRDAVAELIRAAGRRRAPPEDHYRAVRAAARAAWQEKLGARRRRRWYALAASLIAAAGLAAVGITVRDAGRAPLFATLAHATGELALYSDEAGAWRPLAGIDTAVRAGDRLRTGAAGGAAFELAVGGALRVDVATELRVAGAQSVELVNGTLYVDSGNEARAETVEVATTLGRVRDIGTQFEVHLGGDALRVRVRSGRVAVVDSPLGAELETPAGEELELDREGVLERRTIAPDAESWEWAAALAVPPPDGDSVMGYLRWIARETGKSLRFDSARTELRAQLVRWRGDPQGLTPLEVLDAIVATSDFFYELTSDGAILIREG